ncbi:MAG: hypothetical protein KDA28_06845, partial [Phycisphaerales bacterium]|nr:hypothetical protein [Phycisphaerales bacterium]
MHDCTGRRPSTRDKRPMWPHVVLNRPEIGQWEVDLEQVPEAAFESTPDDVDRDVMPAPANPDGDAMDRRVGPIDPEIREPDAVALAA